MKVDRKETVVTFGDFIVAAYRAWGAPKARGVVRLAVNAQVVVFRGRQRFVIPEEQDESPLFNANPE